MTIRDTAAALARVDALHTALIHIVLEGGDLTRIAEQVSTVLDTGVIVTSTDGRERAAAVADSDRDLMDSLHLVDDTGRIRVERIGEQGVGFRDGEIRALRVAASGVDLARLICLRSDRAIGDDDVHALERAAIVAALLITNQGAVTAIENKYQGDFLRDLVLRGVSDSMYVAEHADGFGWALSLPAVVVVAEIDPQPAEEVPASRDQRRAWQERFFAAWRQVCGAIADGIPAGDFSSEVLVLMPVNGASDTTAGHEVVTRAVTGVAGDRGGGRRSFSVGVSRQANSLAELPEAYAQARRAVEVGRRVQGGGSVTFFDELGLHRLIALIPDTAELRSFARDILGPLSDSTTEAGDLRETLQVLLDTNFNVAEAARIQFFHYNTMRYRVSKLERLLGPLSSDPNLRLDVAVALRVLDIVA